MTILEILWINRKDFQAIYECEHCLEKVELSGHDDEEFHSKIIPAMECKYCGKNGKGDNI